MIIHCLRHIIDGKGASTVFNGHIPLVDQMYTKSNHYISGMNVEFDTAPMLTFVIIYDSCTFLK